MDLMLRFSSEIANKIYVSYAFLHVLLLKKIGLAPKLYLPYLLSITYRLFFWFVQKNFCSICTLTPVHVNCVTIACVPP